MTSPLPKILAEQVAEFRSRFPTLEEKSVTGRAVMTFVGHLPQTTKLEIESFLQESLTEAYRAGGEEMYKAIKKAEEIKAQEMTQPVFRGNMMSESLTDKAHERFLADISKDGAITP